MLRWHTHLVLVCVLSCLWLNAATAATLPGYQIINTAILSYIDTLSGQRVDVESNTSQITVAELSRFVLTAQQSLDVYPNQSVSFAHTLSNTGNVLDSYSLVLSNRVADDGDLINLQLSLDQNSNGQLDAAEPSVTDGIQLEPGQSIALLVTGTVPDGAGVGSSLNPGLATGHTIEVELTAASDSQGTAPISNLDSMHILESASLAMHLSNSPECGLSLSAGQAIRYSLDVSNSAAALPVEQSVMIDGVLKSGVLVEVSLPDGLELRHDTEFDTSGYSADALVLDEGSEGNQWVSMEHWSGQFEVSRLGVIMPASHFEQDEQIVVRFAAWVLSHSDGNNKERRFDVTAAIDLDRDELVDVQSNTVCNTSITLGAASSAELRFVRPGQTIAQSIDQLDVSDDSHFRDTQFYRLSSDKQSLVGGSLSGDTLLARALPFETDESSFASPYIVGRDGVYVELVAAPSERMILNTAAGLRYTQVSVQSRGTGDTIILALRETETGSGVFRSETPVVANTSEQGGGRWCPEIQVDADSDIISNLQDTESCVLLSELDDEIEVIYSDPISGIELSDTARVEPVSRVFDSYSLEPVAGAVINVLSQAGPVIDPDTGQALALLADEQGRFVLPPMQTGINYHLRVDPPDEYLFPSRVPPDRFTDLFVSEASYGEAGFNASGLGRFVVSADNNAMVIDIPLDVQERDTQLVLEKQALGDSVELGDAIAYSIVISNRGSGVLDNVAVVDTPAYGFKLMRGSVTRDGVKSADPLKLTMNAGASADTDEYESSGSGSGSGDGGDGDGDGDARNSEPAIEKVPDADSAELALGYQFDIGALEAGQQITLKYYMQATPAALHGDGINSAYASALTQSDVEAVSQTAKARVSVVRSGVLSDDAIVFGKVYVDSSCDWIQNYAEWPIGGVKLYMEDGSFVVTDEDGQYSLYGLRPGLHIVKVDPLTLPLGLQLKPLDNRNAADAGSRFVELSPGDFHRADFATACPTVDPGGVFDRISKRNRGLRGAWLLDEASRFNPGGKSRLPSERLRAGADGDLSSGLMEAARQSPVTEKSDGSEIIQQETSSQNTALEVDVLPQARRQSQTVEGKGLSTLMAGNATMENDMEEAQARIKMGDPKQLASTITADQAKAGTWLWPQSEYSVDGRFMAVVRAGADPVLYVNGEAVSGSQIGERIANRRARAELVAWYGVLLKAGVNQLEVRGKDSFGNERVMASQRFKRPAAGVRMMLRTRQDTLPADGGRSMLPIDVVINDANGYPANGVYFVSLDTTAGEFLENDLQSAEPGVQVRIENGRGKIHIRSSDLSGRMKVSARSGSMQAALSLVQIASARPLLGAGVIELGGRWSTLSRQDDRASLESGFEPEARAAVFLKGRVKNDLSLTLSYDSDKQSGTQLLRDVNPNDHYPSFGDASVRGFEAQSRSKLYIKLERDKHSVMWGDYLTDNRSASDHLARVQRTLTGFNGIYDDGLNYFQAFAARQSDVRDSEEVRGNGTAMLFRISGAPIVAHSEVVERIVRDRDNPGLVLQAERLQRVTDYTLDAVDGLLSFSEVIPSLDENLNPVFIRISYDRQSDLSEYTISGLRYQHQLTQDAIVGLSLTDDQNPISGYTIAGVFSTGRLGLNTTFDASMAGMRHVDNSHDGKAGQVRVEHWWGGRRDHRSRMSWARATNSFTNSDSGVSAGQEQWQLEHDHSINSSLKATARLSLNESVGDGSRFGSAGVFLNKKHKQWSFDAGTRRVWSSDGRRSLSFNTVLLGAERRLQLGGSRSMSVGIDAERDVSDASRFRYGLVSRVQLFRHVHLYSRYEREQQLSQQSLTESQTGSRQWVLGIESDVLPSTELYSEYRMRGSYGGKSMESASGVRGRYELQPGLSINPSVEVVDVFRGSDSSDSIALSLGLTDTRQPNRKFNAQAELRSTIGSRYYGFRASLAQRLNLDWTTLVREEFTQQRPSSGEQTSRHQLSFGLAHRPKLNNAHHALFLANWKEEFGPEQGQDKRSYIVSTHQNRQLSSSLTVSGRMGMKWNTVDFDTGVLNTRASLLDFRAIHDLNRRWEVDVRAGWLSTGRQASEQYSLGLGVAWIADRNLRLGLAYNAVGFEDSELDTQGYNKQGIQFGLQFKFDEDFFQWLSD